MAEYASSLSCAVDEVAANSDILTEILIRLPVRALMRFKSVSKSWLSLIASDFFTLRRNPDPTIVSGIFLHPYGNNPKIDIIPFINTIGNPTHPHPQPQFTDLTFFPGLSDNIRIINSCHGLLLCRFRYTRQKNRHPRQKNRHPDYAVQKQNHDPNYVVLNPTTKQFKILPKCHLSGLRGLTLAFDPSKSPHYKIVSVCVCFRYTSCMRTFAVEYYHQIMVYSSETGTWKASGVSFAAEDREQYTSGVYWNGAVNWFSNWGKGDSVYYNVDEGRLGIIPLPPIPEGNYWYGQEFRRYWESRGHLHLVEINSRMYRVDVYEMERDYSGWFVKLSADLYALEIPRDPRHCLFGILCVVRMERDEESFLVLHVPDKILRYSFGDGALEKICDVVFPQRSDNGRCIEELRYSWFRSYQFIESLVGV